MRSIRHTPTTLATWDTHPGHLSPRRAQPRGRVGLWVAIETTAGDHESQASPSEGTSVQDSPEPALEREVIEVAPGKTAVAVITPKLVSRVNGGVQGVRYAGGDHKSR